MFQRLLLPNFETGSNTDNGIPEMHLPAPLLLEQLNAIHDSQIMME